MNRLLAFLVKRVGLYALLTALTLLASCSQADKQSQLRLAEAARIMEKNPKAALNELELVDITALDKSCYAYYVVLQARALAMNGVDIASLEHSVAGSVAYFSGKKDAPKAAFACYVMAKVYEAKAELVNAIHYYLTADEWADKAHNDIPNFTYPNIPYNIALYYKKDGYYEYSLQFLRKAMTFIEGKNYDYQMKLFTLELMGNNYLMLNKADSTYYFYDAAQVIAKQNGDNVALGRIQYNKLLRLYLSDNYSEIEKVGKQQLATLIHNKDSVSSGLLLAALAKAYIGTNKTDSALTCIYKAKSLLANASVNAKVILYEQLSQAEEKRGNYAQANSYQQQYSELKAEQKNRRVTLFDELQLSQKRREGELLGENMRQKDARFEAVQQRRKANFFSVVVLFLGVGSVGSILTYNTRRRKRSNAAVAINTLRLRQAVTLNLNELAYHVNTNIAEAEEREPILDIVDMLKCVDTTLPALEHFAAKLYGKSRPDYPLLNDTELKLCFLVTTNELKPITIMELLNLTPGQFVRTKESLEQKIVAAKLKFPKGYRRMVKKAYRSLLSS